MDELHSLRYREGRLPALRGLLRLTIEDTEDLLLHALHPRVPLLCLRDPGMPLRSGCLATHSLKVGRVHLRMLKESKVSWL